MDDGTFVVAFMCACGKESFIASDERTAAMALVEHADEEKG